MTLRTPVANFWIRHCVYVGGVINVQEDLSSFSWYKEWMSREEAENKVRHYRQV